MKSGQDIQKFNSQMAHLLSGINSPSVAVFMETLCCDPGINKQVQRKVVEELSRLIANDVFADELDQEFMDDEFMGDGDGPDWDEGARD